MGDRMATRSLPVLDLAPAVAGPAGPRSPLEPDDERLEQFRPEVRALPAFFVWTLGCQMNKSDSEEMAGRLLAAGCAEAPSMEAADLVVINTCAIREASVRPGSSVTTPTWALLATITPTSVGGGAAGAPAPGFGPQAASGTAAAIDRRRNR